MSCKPLDAQVCRKIVATLLAEANGIDAMSKVSQYVCEQTRVRVDEEFSTGELLILIGQQRLEVRALFTESVLSSGKDRFADLKTNDPSLWWCHAWT